MMQKTIKTALTYESNMEAHDKKVNEMTNEYRKNGYKVINLLPSVYCTAYSAQVTVITTIIYTT